MNAAQTIDPTRLVWALAALAVAVLPHLLRVPVWVPLLLAVTSLWLLAAQRRRLRLPGTPLRIALAIGCFIAVATTYHTINGLDAGSAMLVVMLALKLTETRRLRDLVVVLLISYFLTVTNFLYGQSMLTAAHAALTVLVTTAALMQVTTAGSLLGAGEALQRSGLLLAQAVPIMLLLFVLFPRVPGPFWAIPADRTRATTGLSDTLSPGNLSSLVQSDEVAFRVTFDGAAPPPSQRYWRALVLSEFDGESWSLADPLPASSQRLDLGGRPLRYTMQLEPHQREWLIALDMVDPRRLPPGATMLSDYRLLHERPISRLTHIELVAYPDYRADAGPSPLLLERDRALPPGRNPRARALAERLDAQTNGDTAFVEAVLRLFNEQPFVYTLSPPLLDGRHPVDEFLFDSRFGFCEHYASAFTTLARAADIPARVVVGYQGGQLNPYGNHLTVRQSDAHAWAEVWLTGRGWVRVDPTAAVAPERVESGVADALPSGERLPGLVHSIALLRQLRHGLDAFNNAWNEWVLGYSDQKQRDFLRMLGMERPGWRNMVLTLTVLLATFLGGLALWLSWQTLPRPPDPVSRAYRRFCAKLGRVRLHRAGSEGPLAFAARVGEARPDLAGEVAAITDLYVRLRYLPGAGAGDAADLRRRVRALRCRAGARPPGAADPA